jgi:hypothetical protein
MARGVPMLSGMTEQRGLRTGHLVALAGAAVALASLWAPWYRVDLGSLRDALAQRPGIAGTQAGSFLQSLMALLPRSVSGNAWQTLHQTDVLVAIGSCAALAALLAAAGTFGSGIRVSLDAAARLSSAAGAVCALFVAGRALNPPGPNAYLDVRWGAWACLIGLGLMVAGGLSALNPGRASRTAPGQEQGWGLSASTAPPSATPPDGVPHPG